MDFFQGEKMVISAQTLSREIYSFVAQNKLEKIPGFKESFPEYKKVYDDYYDLYEEKVSLFCETIIKNNSLLTVENISEFFLTNFKHLYDNGYVHKKTKTAIAKTNLTPKPKGRPKGSSNKKEVPFELPKYQVTEENFVHCLTDLMWYKQGLKAKELFTYLEYDQTLEKKLYWLLHKHTGLCWKKTQKAYKNFNVERFYAIGERTGYYYEGKILSLSELAKITGKSKQILSYRIKKGMSHFQAISEEINTNMVRKNQA
jgi:hypothetical protein